MVQICKENELKHKETVCFVLRIFYFQYNDFHVCQKGNTKLWFDP